MKLLKVLVVFDFLTSTVSHILYYLFNYETYIVVLVVHMVPVAGNLRMLYRQGTEGIISKEAIKCRRHLLIALHFRVSYVQLLFQLFLGVNEFYQLQFGCCNLVILYMLLSQTGQLGSSFYLHVFDPIFTVFYNNMLQTVLALILSLPPVNMLTVLCCIRKLIRRKKVAEIIPAITTISKNSNN